MAIVSRYLSGDDTYKIVIAGNNDDEPMLSDTLIEKVGKRHSIQKLCETRWTARVDTLSSLIAKYKSITQSLQDILDESSASNARIKASAHLRMLQSSPLIVALVVTQHILSFTRPLTQVLQKTDCDITKAYQDANTCKTVINEQRNDAVFDSIWEKMNVLAACVNIQLEKPRTAKRMTRRSTAGDASDTASKYLKINVFFPFIDNCAALEERFPEDKSAMFLASTLMPLKFHTMSQIETAKIYEWYSPDFLDGDTFYMEIQRWMAFCNHLKDPPTSLSESFILADPDYFPNINTIFHLLLTTPVGSVPCEGSFSALRRLKLWNRTTMTDHRLTGLALMHIHKDKDIDRALVLNKLDASGNRRIGALHL
ncbi:unnamed protein product [Mytilus coruscus]|uniref:HAT C-terminal dimerisation domain-containing protein n=1 Tax=Mytilus coruscus TaxID=42192 RepID=A0A6J8B125_MYTCO|nr:unnamed protein product [Mytilus coruscus]